MKFDDLAKTLAQPMPRHRALRLVVGAVAVAAFPGLRAVSAQASTVRDEPPCPDKIRHDCVGNLELCQIECGAVCMEKGGTCCFFPDGTVSKQGIRGGVVAGCKANETCGSGKPTPITRSNPNGAIEWCVCKFPCTYIGGYYDEKITECYHPETECCTKEGVVELEDGVCPKYCTYKDGRRTREVKYNPDTQCCITGISGVMQGVTEKYPIQNDPACRENGARKRHAGYKRTQEGCGGPSKFKGANFAQACEAHNECYESCNQIDTKTVCDDEFGRDLVYVCKNAHPKSQFERTRCAIHARYEVFPRRTGEISSFLRYHKLQDAACDCC